MVRKAWPILFLMLLGMPAFAQGQKKGPPAPKAAAPKAAASGQQGAESGVTYKQKTVYDFDDDTVTGSLVRPDGEGITTRGGVKQSSLIKIRQHFIPEMLKSAEDI